MTKRASKSAFTNFQTYKVLILLGVCNILILSASIMHFFRVPWPAPYIAQVFSETSQTNTSLPLKSGTASPLSRIFSNKASSSNESSLHIANRTISGTPVSTGVRTVDVNANMTSSGKANGMNATSLAAAGPASLVTKTTLDAVWGPGKPMIVNGKDVVNSRRNISTVPWAKDETKLLCPAKPPDLVGPLAINLLSAPPDPTVTVTSNPGLEAGGHYHPPDCRARHRVAIVIPYRDRTPHLHALIHHLHPILRRQQLDYFILIVELEKPTTFNRGMLLNIGAVEAVGLWDVQCFIFHDVDLLPEDDRNLYTCPENPRHMSAAVDKFKYRLPYKSLVGGVTALTKEHLAKANGYSNLYFGWGGEDDDLYIRLTNMARLSISRYPMTIARYRMFKHTRDAGNSPNPQRSKLLRPVYLKERQPQDGLNSLQYEVKKIEFRPGYTWILVSVDKDKILNAQKVKPR